MLRYLFHWESSQHNGEKSEKKEAGPKEGLIDGASGP
jgi:hypothetical protein